MAYALYDAVREVRTPVGETTAAAMEVVPASVGHATLSELTIPLRRMRTSRKSAIVALALAAAASVFVWRSNGPELQEANASMKTAEPVDAGADGPAATRSGAAPR
jgi:cyanate permease